MRVNFLNLSSSSHFYNSFKSCPLLNLSSSSHFYNSFKSCPLLNLHFCFSSFIVSFVLSSNVFSFLFVCWFPHQLHFFLSSFHLCIPSFLLYFSSFLLRFFYSFFLSFFSSFLPYILYFLLFIAFSYLTSFLSSWPLKERDIYTRSPTTFKQISPNGFLRQKNVCVYLYELPDIYIYIYIYRERECALEREWEWQTERESMFERERERERGGWIDRGQGWYNVISNAKESKNSGWGFAHFTQEFLEKDMDPFLLVLYHSTN